MAIIHPPVDLWSLRQDVIAAESYAATVGTSMLEDLDRLLRLDAVQLVAFGVSDSFGDAYRLRARVVVLRDAFQAVEAARAVRDAVEVEGVER